MRRDLQLLDGARAELRETHISLVLLFESDVYKIKKPVSLGFLDFRDPDRRRAACQAEVALNRRLAPDVYRGVVPVTRDPATGEHRFGGDGPAVDWAVHMRRLPDAWRADVRLERGELTGDALTRIAAVVAAFHAEADASDEVAAYGSPKRIAVNVRENFAQAGDAARALLSEERAVEIERRQLGFLERHAGLLERRAREGRVRDGHGDLRLEHVYIDDDGGIRVLDCIEFNQRFRHADVCADVAFLSMDLAVRGRVDLAETFLASYARASGDFELFRLVDFYESYRAYVRGKIACMTAASARDTRARERAEAEAQRLFTLAYAAQRRPFVTPRVVCVGGPIASGKSTVARFLGGHMGAPVVSSDYTRKQLVGVSPTTPLPDSAWSGAYSHDLTERVYDELLRRGEAVLRSGRPVVLDASWRTRAMRTRARAFAAAQDVPFTMIECRASADVLRARLELRAQGKSVSDGRVEILDEFLARWEQVEELEPDEHVIVDTARPFTDTKATLAESVPIWPVGQAIP